MSLIAHADVGALVILTDADVHAPVVHRHKAVAHSVFHNGLENERRQAQLRQIIGQRTFDMQRALKACLGEHKVVVHIGDLLLKGDKGLVDGQRLAEIGGEDKYRFTGAVGIGQAQTGDGVERVEQKVRVDLRLQGAEFRLLAQRDLMLGLTQLQHDGEEFGKALQRADVGVKHEVRPRGDLEQQRADDLLVLMQRRGKTGVAGAAGKLRCCDGAVLRNGLPRGGRERTGGGQSAARGQDLRAVGQCHLKVRELLAHDVHGALQPLAVLDAAAQIGQALLRDEQGDGLLLGKLDGQVAVQPVKDAHKGHKAERIDQDFRQEDGLLQCGGRGKGLCQQQDKSALDQLGDQRDEHKVARPP